MRIVVSTEEAVIKTGIDLHNISKPEAERIKDIEYRFFEAMIYAQRKYGTINSQTADAFIKEYVGKPKMSRKSFLIHRNSLWEKGWLIKTSGGFALLKDFDFYGKTFKTDGILATILLERIQDVGREHSTKS